MDPQPLPQQVDAQPEAVQAAQPAKPASKIPSLVAILSLSTLCIIGLLLYANAKLKQQIANVRTAPSPRITSTPTTFPKNLTVNWKMYTDAQNRFTFLYPPEMHIIPNLEQIPNNSLYVDVMKVSLMSAIKQMSLDSSKLTEIPIAGSASEYFRKGYFQSNYNGIIAFFPLRNDQTLSISLAVDTLPLSDKNVNDQFDRILSTFKFPDPTLLQANPATDWKIYTNPTYGYSVSYPSSWQTSIGDNGFTTNFYLKPSDPEFISITVHENPSVTEIHAWLIAKSIIPNPNDISTHIQQEDVLIDGIKSVKVLTPVNGGQSTVYIPKGNKVFSVYNNINPANSSSESYAAKNSEVMTQLLSTFKFLESAELTRQITLQSQVDRSCTNPDTCEPMKLIMTIPKNFTVNSVKPINISSGASTYTVIAGNGGSSGPCPMDDSDPSCKYTDEPLTNKGIMRIWEKNGKVFMLNPQSITVQDFYLELAIIQKTGTITTFTRDEINLWKSIFISLTVLKSK